MIFDPFYGYTKGERIFARWANRILLALEIYFIIYNPIYHYNFILVHWFWSVLVLLASIAAVFGLNDVIFLIWKMVMSIRYGADGTDCDTAIAYRREKELKKEEKQRNKERLKLEAQKSAERNALLIAQQTEETRRKELENEEYKLHIEEMRAENKSNASYRDMLNQIYKNEELVNRIAKEMAMKALGINKYDTRVLVLPVDDPLYKKIRKVCPNCDERIVENREKILDIVRHERLWGMELISEEHLQHNLESINSTTNKMEEFWKTVADEVLAND